MRLHRLEIQAFGPFAQRQSVDFDDLSAHGLFLLNGKTGAGKTSILDAVCFALYGSVPGARQAGKRLRSDHADPALAPEVVCEFSARGRRFEVTRSPQWDRPSTRSTKGSVTEQARTHLRELVDGSWVEKSARNDEAAVELGDVLGMSLDQFTKVVMLPQGEFAAFLRADAKERRPLLQRLFDTDRYELIEESLAADAAAARTAFSAAESELGHLLRRAEEEANRHLAPEQLPEDSVPATEKLQHLHSSVERLAQEAGDVVGSGRTALEELRSRIARQEMRLADHTDLLLLQRLEAEQAAGADESSRRARVLKDHRAAELLQSSIRHRDQASSRTEVSLQAAQTTFERAMRHRLCGVYAPDFASGPLELPATGIARAQELIELAGGAIGRELGRIRALVPEEARLKEARVQADRLLQTADQLDRRYEKISAEADATRVAGEQLAVDLAAAEGTGSDVERLGQRLKDAEAVAETVAAYSVCRSRVDSARRARDDARALQLQLKQDWLDLLERRLEQSAAELARTLEQGEPCPVCGSDEHPLLATADSNTMVSREDETAARQEHARAETAYVKKQEGCAALENKLAALAAQGGETDPDVAAAAVQELEELLGQAQEAERNRERLRGLIEKSRNELAELLSQGSELAVAAAGARSDAEAAARQTDELEQKIASVLPSGGTLQQLAEGLSALDGLLKQCRQSLGEYSYALATLERCGSELEDAIAGSEFGSEADVLAALLSARELEQAQLQDRTYASLGQRIELLQASDRVARARQAQKDGEPLPDEAELEDLRHKALALEKELQTVAVRHGVLQDSAEQLLGYCRRLETEAASLEPVRARFELVQSVADTVRGLGENERKMTLTTYVLAARLEQIAAAASERLNAMTDGRYRLVHDDSKSGNKKSGLGLHVSDEWTGQRRDTSTLSGGESFMASLALALGLADVVQAETGGVDIETLFVDEGFGSLDEQALEQVMDALEGLRDGGRVVGLVSHVAEMKQRIGAQLHISKGRDGSTVRMMTAESPILQPV
ncbi:AAA family ATPase [Crystallibacter degradans]|uniref:AAA family ATPase n=1 Tax=Crystallibacter degradans TaxID=2726743 RepID=UPI0014728FD3|nr:SMC family ATPase [Arthrobacter sp. SF27]